MFIVALALMLYVLAVLNLFVERKFLYSLIRRRCISFNPLAIQYAYSRVGMFDPLSLMLAYLGLLLTRLEYC